MINKKSDHNQNPEFYSKDYYLNSCAGSSEFDYGKEHSYQVFDYIFDHIDDLKGKSILDLGCGRGEIVLSCARKGATTAVGLDFSKDAYEICKKNLEHSKDLNEVDVRFYHANALEHIFDEKFDYIFLTDIVEHLYDDQNKILFNNIKKYLKHDGKVFIHTMPTREFIKFGQFFKYFLNLLRFRKTHILTYEQQAKETHVNLQSRHVLQRYLDGYKYKIWYGFTDKSFIKNLIAKTPFVRFISANLWAICELEEKR